MGITDELREYTEKQIKWLDTSKVHYRKLFSIVDRIDAEYQKAIRELNNLADASVLLPVDADGEVIHIGDALKDGAEFKSEGVVKCLMLDKSGWFVGFGNGWTDTTIHEWRHYHEPTVEDMLWELLGKIAPTMEDDEAVPIVKAYAEKLRLADEGKEQ